MKVITLCGSLKFMDDMMAVGELLSIEGYCVLTPVYHVLDCIKIEEDMLEKLKLAHLKRIELSDAIFVLDIDNYIGSSTKLEIEYALKLGKEIIYYSKNKKYWKEGSTYEEKA